MVSSPSNRLADRYRLRLDDRWRAWFDHDAQHQGLDGPFHSPIDVAELLEAAPADLWPGFMLPDTLPIVSNEYGDWWCARIGPDDQIVEVVQWSHAGGDWLPVGQTIVEAALWDHVQHWRTPAIEVAQAAHEYPPRDHPESLGSSNHQRFIEWLSSGLNSDPATISQLIATFDCGRYRQGLEQMIQCDWATGAAACELVELALQAPVARLADNRLAMICGINWVPEYTSWLFDTNHIPDQARQLLREHAPDVQFEQDWQAAEHWSELLQSRRQDLNWTGSIAGWAACRRGDFELAIRRFFDNRYTSAFTDQSVRLRSHWFADHFGKFCVAQLARLVDHLRPEQMADPYLQLLWNTSPARSRPAVRQFWLERAGAAASAGEYAEGYRCFTAAGWDLGAERMSDYIEILDGLVDTAARAGWQARATVAAAHAEALKRRLAVR